jgi:hypothetical protein
VRACHNYSKHWPALRSTHPKFAVAFDSSTAKRLEAIAQEDAGEAGTNRRLALAVLSKSFSELQQAVAVAPHAASNSYEQHNLVSDGAPAV